MFPTAFLLSHCRYIYTVRQECLQYASVPQLDGAGHRSDVSKLFDKMKDELHPETFLAGILASGAFCFTDVPSKYFF